MGFYPPMARYGLTLMAIVWTLAAPAAPVQTSYLWHLHQPIYWVGQRAAAPDHYEAAWDTIQAQSGGRQHPSDDISQIFSLDDRKAAYQYRPRDSVQTILGQPDAGVQVNYSGALIENVNSLAGRLGGYSAGWQGSFSQARQWTTSGGKPRMDMVNFTYHHALAPLHSAKTLEMELRLHQRQMELNWGTNPGLSRGYFPTEMAFSESLIPVLKSVGIEWAIVSGNHLSRACSDFPLVLGSGGENCEPPNKADVLNPAQGYYYRQTISRGCSPANAAPFSYTPHRARYVDPNTGTVQDIVVVPAAQEFSWVDGYQSFGASEISDVASRNGSRPELVLLAHDGDNAFGGGFSYYMECVQSFVNGAAAAGHHPTTIEQYLQTYPVPTDDVVHVEDGGWVNADGDFGSPTFINWLYPLLAASGQPDPINGWHEKAREYAMFTATENRVRTAEQVAGVTARIDQVRDPQADATAVERAWHYYLGSLDSGNVYYGTPGDMEVRSSIGCNNATSRADAVLGSTFTDRTEPTIFSPQRWPYNPGGVNFGVSTGYQQKTLGPDFTIWTFVYDAGGLSSVNLKWRVDNDGQRSTTSTQNDTYAGGSEVGPWQSIQMNRHEFAKTNVYNKGEINYYVTPTYIADHASATITGQSNKLIDYYVEAVDAQGNVGRSPIKHVWVGDQGSSGGGGTTTGSRVTITPSAPVAGHTTFVQYNPAGGPLQSAGTILMHYGFSNWGTVVSPDPAMSYNATSQRYETTVTIAAAATQLDCVFNNGQGTWDNNSGSDWHFTVSGATQTPPWTIDGIAEPDTMVRAQTSGGLKLWGAVANNRLYVATQVAASGRDHFIFVARNPGALKAAPWAKAGQVAGWDALLANESTNNYSGWFDSNGSGLTANVLKAAGGANGVLEGEIDLAQLSSAGASGTVYIAAAEYATADGGAMTASTQSPAGNGDGNLDASEYVALSYTSSVGDWSMYQEGE